MMRNRLAPFRSLRGGALVWPLLVALGMLAGCGGRPAAPATAQVPATDALAGIWVFSPGPAFPGLRYARIERDAGGWRGGIVTDWYGELPMSALRVDGDTAYFELDNGNPKLPPLPWTARLQQGQLQVSGKLWYQQVDLAAHRGGQDDAKRLAFKVAPLPTLAALAPDGQAATPPMGWSSWNKFADRIDDATIRQIADALVSSGLRDAGYVHVNIDDGWQGQRDASGVLQPNAHFPDMKALADYLHARGLKLGIYSSPGPRTCAGYEGSYGHVEQDAATWAGWGVDYVKYDLCSGEGIFRSAEDVRKAYLQMGHALRGTGRRIVYSLCQYGRDHVGQWGRQVGGHLWRTTGDIEDNYAVMADIGFNRNGDPLDAGPGGWNDADMLEVGNGGMSLDEYRTHMALWAISAAPLLLGNDLRHMDAQTLALLRDRDLIAIDQDRLGRQGSRVRRDGDLELWRKELADGGVVLAVFNRGDHAGQAALLPGDAAAPVRRWRTLWQAGAPQALPATVKVPAHGVVVLIGSR